MRPKGQKKGRDIVYSFVEDVLANFFVITFTALLVLFWMTTA